MKITHIIWDWNGTLLDDIDLCINVINSILIEENLQQIDKDTYRRKFCFPITQYYTNVGFDISGNNFERLSKKYIEKYQPRSKDCKLVDNAREVLHSIYQMGIKQIVLSASRKDLMKDQVENAGIHNYFNELLGLNNIQAKSKKEIGLEWKNKHGLSGDEMVVIGDTYHDYETAQFLGAHFLYYTKGHQEVCNEEIKEVSRIHNLKDVLHYLEKNSY